uniref:Uncharacterized protein n=1 Tax=Salarias fasciatus TaxID=181472 RepID=A0A672HIU3_SALFA
MFLGGSGGGAASQVKTGQFSAGASKWRRGAGAPSSPPVGKLLLSCDSDRGLDSPHATHTRLHAGPRPDQYVL